MKNWYNTKQLHHSYNQLRKRMSKFLKNLGNVFIMVIALPCCHVQVELDKKIHFLKPRKFRFPAFLRDFSFCSKNEGVITEKKRGSSHLNPSKSNQQYPYIITRNVYENYNKTIIEKKILYFLNKNLEKMYTNQRVEFVCEVLSWAQIGWAIRKRTSLPSRLGFWPIYTLLNRGL